MLVTEEQNKTRTSGQKIAIFVVALVVALLHTFYVRSIFSFPTVGGYFLIATILFAIGAFASLTSGKLAKRGVTGLFALSMIDCALIYATRTFPTPFFGGENPFLVNELDGTRRGPSAHCPTGSHNSHSPRAYLKVRTVTTLR